MKIWYKKIENLYCRRDHIYDWFALKKSIEEHGIIDPIILTKFDNTIVDGSHRLAIAKLIYPPDKEIPCVYYDKEFRESPFIEERFKSEYRLAIPNAVRRHGKYLDAKRKNRKESFKD